MRLVPLPVPPAPLVPAAPAATPAPVSRALKVWVDDPSVVVQELVVDTGGLRPSYLGPPESRRVH